VDDVSALLDILQTPYFQTGLRVGLAALAIGWMLRLVLGKAKPPLPIAGLLVATAIMVTLSGVEGAGTAELPAVLAIFAGALVTRLPGIPSWAQPLLVVPGSIWFAGVTPVTDLTWVRVLIAVMIPLAGFLVTDFEKRHSGLGLGVTFYGIAVFGMFAAVPDTEWGVTLLAVTFPITFLAWPSVAASLGPEGAYLAIMAFLWVTAQGGMARPPSIIGSVACLGLLLLEPVVIAIKPSAVRLTTWFTHNAAGAVIAALPQFVVMILCSRVAARFDRYLPTVIIVTAVFVLVVVLAMWVPERMVSEEEAESADPLFPGAPY
jgi:hypothetical protein